MQHVNLTGALTDLLNNVERNLNGVEAHISSNVNYMEVLDRGRVVGEDGVMRGSEQAPDGFVRAFLPEYENDLREEVNAEIGIAIQSGRHIDDAILNGIDSGALRIASKLIPRTPIDTSRARNSWQIELTDGKKIQGKDLS